MQKHRISTNIGKDQIINVDLTQDFDLLEILSLKFTQKDIYSGGICSDYGVVVGRVFVNGGFGVPNAKISIFVPLSDTDENDPVISKLYPYKDTTDLNDDGVRYNLLPSRKQHTGHLPVGTFFDQEDIITREEVLEVFEKYYKYTVKTNEAGDFMIWGVPVGTQKLHVDIDLSDMGCQSLLPYDLVYEGVATNESFLNPYTFNSSKNIDTLPQVISFDKNIEVYPFFGNEDLCEIGISRTDFDLKERGIRLDPYAILMGGSFTDSKGRNNYVDDQCDVGSDMGQRCSLITKSGDIEAIRFTGDYEKNPDGTTNLNRPILETFEIDSSIDENGNFFFRVPMNLEYVTTSEYGDLIISNDPNIGIPTKGNYRFRFSLQQEDNKRKTVTGKILVPNIREYHINDTTYLGSYSTINPKSYSFSTKIDDYPTEAIPEICGTSEEAILEGRRKVPQDYFYQFRYNRVYTVSQFINKQQAKYTLGTNFSFNARKRKESFVGIKDISPSNENDCSETNNHFPINDAVMNKTRASFFILNLLSNIEYASAFIFLLINEVILLTLFLIAKILEETVILRRPAGKIFKAAKEFQFKNIRKYSLITYPDCYDCVEDNPLTTTEIIPPTVNISAITGTTPTLSNFYLQEKNGSTQINTGCDSYEFQNDTQLPVTINYYDCNGNYLSRVIPPIDGALVCGKAGQTGFPIEPVVKTDGCFQNSDDDLYFNASMNGYLGYEPTNIPTINTGTHYENELLYQTYLLEIDIFGDNKTVFVPVGYGQTYPIVYDMTSSKWKIQDIYSYIMSTIMTQIGAQYDEVLVGTCHPEQGIVKIKNIWYVENIDPTSNTVTNPDRNGCSKYDFIFSDEDKIGQMHLQGIKLPLSGSTQNFTSYVSAINYYNTHRPPNSFLNKNGVPIYDQLDENYDTVINGSNLSECDPVPQYNIAGVASVYRKKTIFGSADTTFNEDDVRCIYRGIYYGRSNDFAIDEDVTFNGTLTGWSEFRDGVYTIVPLAGKTFELLRSYQRRKLFGKIMCNDSISYVFTNSWLNGSLYFFPFKFFGGAFFCRDCTYFKAETGGYNLYYRSTPYNPNFTANNETQYNYTVSGTTAGINSGLTVNYNKKTKGFYGTRKDLTLVIDRPWYRMVFDRVNTTYYKRDINFPTTIIDLGPRISWIKEVCFDPELDVNSSVVRNIGSTSFRYIDDLMEYVIQSKELKERGKLDVLDLFDKRGYGLIDGDVAQLLNFNTQTGIYPFEFEQQNSPYTSYYSTYFDKVGAIGINLVYDIDNPNTPQIEPSGVTTRKSLNTPGRLGETSQKVPYFMWDTDGHGFGEVNNNGEMQSYYTGKVYNQRIQEIGANLNADPNQDIYDDYYFDPYSLPPIRDCIEVNGVKKKYNDNYKEYTVNGEQRHLMEIGTPFHFIFGLRKIKTAFDKFIDSFGPN